MATKKTYITVLLPLVRTSYMSVETPKDFKDGKAPKYQSAFLIPKGSAEDRIIHEAVHAAINDKVNKDLIGTWQAHYRWPIHDGDAREDANTKGHWVINVKSDRKPALWDATRAIRGDAKMPIAEPNALYSGCYVAVYVTAYPFTTSGKGIALVFGDGGICKRKDGEEFSGSAPVTAQTAVEMFGQFIPEGAPSFGGQQTQGYQGQGYQGQGYQGQGYQGQGQGYQGQGYQGQGYQGQGQGYPGQAPHGQPIPDEFA